MLAYAASFIIEKSVNIALGKISSAIVISTLVHPREQSSTIKRWIARRVRGAFSRYSKFWLIFRILILTPSIPFIIISFWLDTFDYYKSRIPKAVFTQIKKRAREKNYGTIGLRTKWYKIIEHDVINNNQLATQRMYNYLVISGIFRSIGFVFLLCSWAEFYYGIHKIIDHHEYTKAIMSDVTYNYNHLLMYVIYNILFMFCTTAYIKFSRRYVEEALFAFALTDERK